MWVLSSWEELLHFSLCDMMWCVYIYTHTHTPPKIIHCSISWGCRILQLHLCRGVRTSNKCPRYDTKQSDGEASVILELWGIWSTLSLPLLPAPLWPGVIAPDRVLSKGQIELNCILMLNWIAWIEPFWNLSYILMLNWVAWNRTVLKFKFGTYAKLNCLKWNCFFYFETVLTLNWIVRNRAVLTKTILRLNWIVRNRAVLTKTILRLNWIVWNRVVYLYKNGFGIR